MLNEKDLLLLANIYTDIDPDLSGIILTLANCRMGDMVIEDSLKPKMRRMEREFINFCLDMTNHAMYEVNYHNWVKTGGTENETNA